MEFIINRTFSAMYCIKLMRFCGAWLSIYIARRFFTDDYIDTTMFAEKPPARLTQMVRNVAAVQLVVESFIAICIFMAKHMTTKGKPILPALANDDRLVMMLLVDAACSWTMAISISYIMARIMGNRKVFNYVDQGTRAARALEEIMVNVFSIVYLIPFFLMI
jgi:hypothetical protein